MRCSKEAWEQELTVYVLVSSVCVCACAYIHTRAFRSPRIQFCDLPVLCPVPDIAPVTRRVALHGNRRNDGSKIGDTHNKIQLFLSLAKGPKYNFKISHGHPWKTKGVPTLERVLETGAQGTENADSQPSPSQASTLRTQRVPNCAFAST